MKLIKLFNFILIITLILSCTLNFNPKSDKNLHKQYKYSEKADDIIIFYNVYKNSKEKIVNILFKNKSNFFMTNVSIKVTSSLSTKINYFSLGNIKNGNSKSFTVKTDLDTNELHLNYEYYLTNEDSFLRIKPDSYIGKENLEYDNLEYKKSGKKILFLK